MLRVALADRHTGVRSGMRTILADDPGLELVNEVAYAGDLLSRCREARRDGAMIDVIPTDRSGQASLEALHRRCPELRLVALTFTLEHFFIQECLSAGAAGVVAAEDIPEEPVSAIWAVPNREIYLSRGVRRTLEAGPPASQP